MVLHHTQVPAAWLAEVGWEDEAEYMRSLQRAHFERDFADVGYHFVVMPSGRIFLGRPTWARGAHAVGHNGGTVGLAIAGDFDLERPTGEAIAGLEKVYAGLASKRPTLPLVGHGELLPRRCPGRFLRSYLQDVRAAYPEGARAAIPHAARL